MISHNPVNARRVLSVFSLVMINVIAVDSLRTLPFSAVYGFSLVFYYLLAALLFFVPTILVTAELATGWPNTGGVYVWVREAFGLPWAFLTIWLQWIYNVVWYPTIFSLIAVTLAYLFDPALAQNKVYIICMILSLLWGITLINSLGMRASSLISTIGAVVGTLLPMLLIVVLGVVWLATGHVSQIHFTVKEFLPDWTDFKNLALLVAVIFGLMGMEMSAVHAEEVRTPKRDYPVALAISSILILVSLILSSLAIAIVVPHQQLNIISGLLDAFELFLKAYHLDRFFPLIPILIAIGSLSCAAAWLIGPAKGLLVAIQDQKLFPKAQILNSRGAPAKLLVVQSLIATVLCSLFLLVPSVSSFYWLLTALTGQLAMIFYILLFATAIRLHYKKPHVLRSFRIPGGKVGMWLVSGTGIAVCLLTFLIGFMPPAQVSVGRVTVYEMVLIGGIFLLCAPPLLLRKRLT